MKNLVKKIRSLENRLSGLAQQNRKLVGLVKNGVGDGVKELEKLVVQQNEEIVRYRMHLANLAASRAVKKEY